MSRASLQYTLNVNDLGMQENALCISFAVFVKHASIIIELHPRDCQFVLQVMAKIEENLTQLRVAVSSSLLPSHQPCSLTKQPPEHSTNT